jgi:hypothetical protein
VPGRSRGRTEWTPPHRCLAGTDDSIYHVIRRNLDPLTGRLAGDLELPDEAARKCKNGLHFTACAEDGVATHHIGRHTNPERAKKLACSARLRV